MWNVYDNKYLLSAYYVAGITLDTCFPFYHSRFKLLIEFLFRLVPWGVCGPEINWDPGVNIDINNSPKHPNSSLSCFVLSLFTCRRPDLGLWVTLSCQDAGEVSAPSLQPLW